jgi:hypothetical protein
MLSSRLINTHAPPRTPQDLAADNERLRLAEEAARGALARLEGEHARLRREGARMAAAAVGEWAAVGGCLHPPEFIAHTAHTHTRNAIRHTNHHQAERQSEFDATVASLESKVDRLTNELEEAAVGGEVAAAKGRRYDKLEARAEAMVRAAGVCCACCVVAHAVDACVHLLTYPQSESFAYLAPQHIQEAELARLAAVEASSKRLEQQLQRSEVVRSGLEGKGEVLEMERAHLTREVTGLMDRIEQLEEEAAAKADKISQLKRARADLHCQLAEAVASTQLPAAERAERELGRLQAAAAAEIEAVRRCAARCLFEWTTKSCT